MPFIDFQAKKPTSIFPGVHSAMEHSDHITYGYVLLEKSVKVPVHSHPNEQWTFVLEGELEFTLENETKTMQPGMGVLVPANALHAAHAITECKLIDVFTPVREDYKALE